MKRGKRGTGVVDAVVSAFSRNFGLKALSLALAILVYCVLSPKSEKRIALPERVMPPPVLEAAVETVQAVAVPAPEPETPESPEIPETPGNPDNPDNPETPETPADVEPNLDKEPVVSNGGE